MHYHLWMGDMLKASETLSANTFLKPLSWNIAQKSKQNGSFIWSKQTSFRKAIKLVLKSSNIKFENFTLNSTISQQPESRKSKRQQTMIWNQSSISWRNTFMKAINNACIFAAQVRISIILHTLWCSKSFPNKFSFLEFLTSLKTFYKKLRNGPITSFSLEPMDKLQPLQPWGKNMLILLTDWENKSRKSREQKIYLLVKLTEPWEIIILITSPIQT